MFRIVHLITGLGTGGAEMMLVRLLSKTDRRQFEPVVISLSGRGALGGVIEDLGIPVLGADMNSGRPTMAGICRSISLARNLKADIIQGWMSHGNLASQLSGTLMGSRVSVIWNIRQSIYSLRYYGKKTAALIKIGSYISRLPKAIVYNSKSGAEQHEALGYQRDKRVIIPNGFDVDTFRPDSEAIESVRKELKIPMGAFIIGLIARNDPLKDHFTFLHAASLMLEFQPNVHFVLAGFGVDRRNKILNNLIMDLNLPDNVHLLGERFDIPRLNAAMDVATSSSYAEGFPNVIGEAMSCGVPCVVTDVGDSALLVGDTGIVVEPKRPESLCKGWVKLIEMPAKDRQRIGEAARKRIIDHFSIDFIARQYEQLYREVFHGQKR
jgi:glycosyltransferase involved in cell wall biosynthesis